MSSCLSGRTYGYNLENLVKPSLSSSNSNSNSNSNSPSSTLSGSSNSLMPVSTRKPRTTRKRPNQTYNEAVTLLSTACPNIFSTTKKHNNHSTLPNQHSYLFNNPIELLLPEKPNKAKLEIPREIEFNGNLNWSQNSSSLEPRNHDDFETESMLDEEIGEGIDSIFGNPNSVVEKDNIANGKSCFCFDFDFNFNYNPCFGYPVGVGIGGNLECKFGFGLRNGVRAMKNVGEGDWWSFPAVDVTPEAKTEKSEIGKKEKVMKSEPECLIVGEERSSIENGPLLMLKLSYDKVLKAWSETGSPVPESPGSDIHAKLAQIDLFSENEGVREASVVRYKEKRHTRFFSKKIRYQVRKVNADRRPRSKGRFVRRPNSPTCEET